MTEEQGGAATSITVEFVPTKTDHYRAIRDAAARHPSLRWMSLALLLAPLFLIGLSMRHGEPLGEAIVSHVFWIIVAPIFVWVMLPLSQRAQARYARRRSADTGSHPQVFTFHDDGVSFGDAGAQTELAWTAIRRILETRDSMLLYVSAREAAFFPLRAIAPAELDVLRTLLRRHLGERAELRSASDDEQETSRE